MSTGTLKIHSENILPIIKKWLYTDREIFLRELVSNSCDAMSKLKVLRENGEIDVKDEEFKVLVAVNKEAKTLTVTDTGIGMSSDEVKKYIAQLAFSGAEEFVKKYEKSTEKDPIIGHFGLGFYSAFMVSSKVEIDTLSYQADAKPVYWSSDGSSKYKMKEGKRQERGTTITLHIDSENEEFLEEGRLKSILQKHCLFLPFPIFLGEEKINTKEPLWTKAPSECTEEEYIEFYKHLYPFEPDPIFWIHLNVDYPFNLKGILYFPKITRQFDFQKSNIKLFCNRVFVSDQCQDLIPDYLTVLRGTIDSPDIPLNVSRSMLQMDRTVRQLGSHISKKVSDKLGSIYTTDRENFLKRWPDIEMIIKLGVLQDDKFYDRVKEFLVWKNSEGEWTTVEDYQERNKEKTQDKVFYDTSREGDTSHFLKMYRDRGIEVLIAGSHLDTPLMNALETKTSLKFQRIDGAIDDAILDKEREKTVLNNEGKSQAAEMADFFRKQFDAEKIEVEAKSLASDQLPAFVVLKEEFRRMRDFLALSGQDKAAPSLMDQYTFVVNTNSPLIETIHNMKGKDETLAKAMTKQLFDLALLSQREIDPSKLSEFISQSTDLLQQLASKAIED